MKYTMNTVVELHADSEHEAYHFLRHALDHAKKAEIVIVDSEVIETSTDAEDDGVPSCPRCGGVAWKYEGDVQLCAECGK